MVWDPALAQIRAALQRSEREASERKRPQPVVARVLPWCCATARSATRPRPSPGGSTSCRSTGCRSTGANSGGGALHL